MPSSSAKAVFTAEAPAPSPLMPQAVVQNGMVYCSGSLGIDPATNDFVKGTFQDRVRQSLANLEKVLMAANSNLKNVVKVNIFITSPQLFAPLNEVYAEVFNQEVKPCRSCVVVAALGLDADVEIECTAFVGGT
ncbi:hypothetical protein M409DRAFT_36205 [Zasmidium cellare ATCC 36951]|uniref:Uncharacterized protein n=1 Tax=Zasmidium cellare ATCC 36951 TaxID=1080233 RepID=A0A6A6CQQ6_ZASCE|nr:uncharacterized protein M409DRAFT_36205 [Zasmidium cellare ATCC 36951]KAF2169494.1 hypothetical protein M409DRAFT_36205 [Zasmidium cellare ATCC 36951]